MRYVSGVPDVCRTDGILKPNSLTKRRDLWPLAVIYVVRLRSAY